MITWSTILFIVFILIIPLIFYVYLDCSFVISEINCREKKNLVILFGGPIIWVCILVYKVMKGLYDVFSLIDKNLIEPFSIWLKTDTEI